MTIEALEMTIRSDYHMTMNRQQKRMLRKQGEVAADGSLIARQRQQPPPSTQRERVAPMQFLREVQAELRKVAWPSRAETIHYSVIVLITVVVLTTMIAGLDWAFSKLILELFES